jgi:hypothetical protein
VTLFGARDEPDAAARRKAERGALLVAAGDRVTVTGRVRGALIVEQGAEVTVRGSVSGGVENRGGRVKVVRG